MYRFTTGTTQIMGILNVTPDSFSDGGKYISAAAAVQRAKQIELEGADILDIGAQSTRPGHVPLSPEEEIRRLLLVLEALRDEIEIPISVDTFYPEAAVAALEYGAVIVNDVSGIVSRDMARVVRHYGAGWVLMQRDVPLRDMVSQAAALGLEKEQLCADPGIGFTETREEDVRRLACTGELKVEGVAYLVGVSRKRVTGEDVTARERLGGSIAAQTVAQLGGADILRVHDVKEAVQARDLTRKCIDMKAKTL